MNQYRNGHPLPCLRMSPTPSRVISQSRLHHRDHLLSYRPCLEDPHLGSLSKSIAITKKMMTSHLHPLFEEPMRLTTRPSRSTYLRTLRCKRLERQGLMTYSSGQKMKHWLTRR